MPITSSTNLDYLIDSLRLTLGDTNSASYRYTDDWLRTSLVLGVQALMTWWNYKYLINDSTNYVERNPNHTYLFASPPIVQKGDERAIVLMASIIIREGSLEESSWNIGSWRDAEISYSNIQGGKLKDKSLQRAIEELESLVGSPGSKLAHPIKGSLPGYLNNDYEYD